MTDSAIISTAQACAHISEALDVPVDTKTFRRFLRSHVKAQGGVIGQDTPGRGRRYALQASELDAMTQAFAAWRSAPNAVTFTFTAQDDA